MKRKDKLVIAVICCIMANLIIAVGIINNAGVSSNKNNCFTTEGGVEVCR